MTRSMKFHVKVTDETGRQLADVDAFSTADGLAYFLRSRGVVADATEQSVKEATGDYNDDATLVFTEKSWDGLRTLRQFKAESVAF